MQSIGSAAVGRTPTLLARATVCESARSTDASRRLLSEMDDMQKYLFDTCGCEFIQAAAPAAAPLAQPLCRCHSWRR